MSSDVMHNEIARGGLHYMILYTADSTAINGSDNRKQIHIVKSHFSNYYLQNVLKTT